MPDPERELEIPPFPIEELLTSQDREDIKSCAEELVSSTGEEPVYLTKPQMDERLASLRGFKGSFMETDDPLATGELEKLPSAVFAESGSVPPVPEVGIGGKPESGIEAEAAELFEAAPVIEEKGEAAEAEVAEGEVVEKQEPPAEAKEEPAVPVLPELSVPAIVRVEPPELPEDVGAKIGDRPDRRVSLVFFGAGLIGVGVLWALIGALFFVADERVDGGFDPGFAPVVWCGVWAITYLVLGFGNVCFRRWARSLAVVTGWVWMAIGVSLVIAVGVLFGELTSYLDGDGGITAVFEQGAENLMVTLLGGITLMAIFVPGVMILYASAPSVKATCSKWQKQVSWTDRRATAMLVFGGLLVCLAFWFGAGAARETWFLWYGAVVEGLPAQQIFAGACGAGLVLAVLTLDLRRGIWWVLLVGVLAGAGVLAGPWVELLVGGDGGGAGFGESGEGGVKIAGLVVGVWVAMLVFVLFLRRCLAKGGGGGEGENGGTGGHGKTAGVREPVVEGA